MPNENARLPLVYVLDLKDEPDLIARYRAWHEPGAVPEAVTCAIRDSGVEAMDIFLCGNRLVILLTPGDGFDAAARSEKDAANPAVQAWEATMDSFQQRLPFAAPDVKWVPMERIYALHEQIAHLKA